MWAARHCFSLVAVAALTLGLGGNFPPGAALAENALSSASRIEAVYRVDLGSFNLGTFRFTAAFHGDDYEMRGEGRFTLPVTITTPSIASCQLLRRNCPVGSNETFGSPFLSP